MYYFKNDENDLRKQIKQKYSLPLRRETGKNYLTAISFLHIEISKLAVLVAFQLQLRKLQDNYPDLRLESTLSTVLDGNLETA